MSGFLTLKGVDVVDPVDNTTTRNLSDLKIRIDILEKLVKGGKFTDKLNQQLLDRANRVH